MKIYKNMMYGKNNEKYQTADIYYPEENSRKILLIYFHGGGLEAGDKSDEDKVYKEVAQSGITIVSANYRLYPNAKYPDYLEDALEAVIWAIKELEKYDSYEKIYIGGISAGAYISMMLFLNDNYQKEIEKVSHNICGYIFDAGQPTVHYNILRERKEDTRAIRVDEAAPIYHIKEESLLKRKTMLYFIVAQYDMIGRKEQNELMIKALEAQGYPKTLIRYEIIPGYEHVGYVNEIDNKNEYPYAKKLIQFCLSDHNKESDH